jgi:hypothetical protein
LCSLSRMPKLTPADNFGNCLELRSVSDIPGYGYAIPAGWRFHIPITSKAHAAGIPASCRKLRHELVAEAVHSH